MKPRSKFCAACMGLGLAALIWASLPRIAWAQYPGGQTARADVARFRVRAETTLMMAGADRGTWGVLITDADTGEVLYALNPRRYFQPASNAKLFTTAMALATLGPDFRIHTAIVGTGDRRDGRLRGNLELIGAGDASLTTMNLNDMAEQIAAKGVKVVEGNVIADDSYFERGRFPSGWTIDDTVWAYGAAVSAVSLNDNTLRLMVRPAKKIGAALEFSLEPRPNIYQVRSRAVTSAAPVEEPQVSLSREPDSRIFQLGGSLPIGASARLLQVAVQEPAENTAALLGPILEAHGIEVRGHARARHFGDDTSARSAASAASKVLAEHVSAPLIDDVRQTNKMSLNLHAELMLRVAAREKAAAQTMDQALKFAEQFRQQIGMAKEDALFTDGSGLSRNDLVTPEAVVQLLSWTRGEPWGEAFRASLPIAGIDGTLEGRMKGTAAAGRIQAKTGFTDHVEGLSGFATTASGEHLVFSMFGNGNGIANHDATDVLDAICIAMIEELGSASTASKLPLQ